jgi:hypothetical protein
MEFQDSEWIHITPQERYEELVSTSICFVIVVGAMVGIYCWHKYYR